MNSTASNQLTLSTEVRFLKGVGPRRAEHFAQLGVLTVGDLLEHFPRSYEFVPEACPIGELLENQQACVAGQVVSMRWVRHSRPPRLEMIVQDDSGMCRLIWFHGQYLKDKFLPGDTLRAWGKVTRYKETLQIVNPSWQRYDPAQPGDTKPLTVRPVYPASGDLSAGEIARVFNEHLERLAPLIPEWYDDAYRSKRQFPLRADAFAWIHRPADDSQAAVARRRLAYDELFLMQLGVALRREKLRRTQPAYPMSVDERLDQRIRRLFPFELTDDQNRVIEEICRDLGRSEPMNRLLQGDVGSGKTVVALYAALVAVGYHRQVAIMAPTEVLAEQHFLSIERYLSHSRVRRKLLTGSVNKANRAEILQGIAQGQIDLVVGTQALLEKHVEFERLALVIIDEQHKFGVRQRERFRGKDVAPHYLVMTATPIPRTLAMTVFGDLDISEIQHLPPGRTPIETHWIRQTEIEKAYQFIRQKLAQGQQVYFVYPRVYAEAEEEEIFDAMTLEGAPTKRNGSGIKAAESEWEHLRHDVFPDYDVALLHGQMDSQSKQQVMQRFRNGQAQVLVATVVIEVGVDVPNATVMVIEHAERFGLAQLHQLRGRIGRGTKQSYCLLISDAETEEAQQRLDLMTQYSNGFDIAMEDLKMRGPGEMMGTAQHGLPSLKLADLIRDADLLRMARRDALQLAQSDPRLERPENGYIRQALLRRWGASMVLGDVG